MKQEFERAERHAPPYRNLYKKFSKIMNPAKGYTIQKLNHGTPSRVERRSNLNHYKCSEIWQNDKKILKKLNIICWYSENVFIFAMCLSNYTQLTQKIFRYGSTNNDIHTHTSPPD